MAIDHKAVTDAERHPPKGASTASASEFLAAKGADDTEFRAVQTNELGTTGGAEGDTVRVKADGTLEFIEETGTVHGYMGLANNSTVVAVTAAGDATLNTDSQYIKITNGSSDLWDTFTDEGVIITDDYIQIEVAGDYEINYWASANSNVINTLIAIKFSTDDTNNNLSSQKVKRDYGGSNTFGVGAASGIFTSLSEGYKISLWIAADKNINYLAEDGGLSVKLLKAD